jgi:hypothetical protein
MKRKPDDMEFPPDEAQRRFEAALRGSRLVGHKTLDQLRPTGKPKAKPRKSPGKRRAAVNKVI